jgi:uncharacterized membrane protein
LITVTLYRIPECPACEQAIADLHQLQSSFPFNFLQVDIQNNPVLNEQFGGQAPIVEIGPYRLKSPFSKQDLQAALGASIDRERHLGTLQDQSHAERLRKGHTFSKADLFTTWLSNHYTLLFNLILAVYLGIPFLAPVLMKVGMTGPARVIYTVYRPFCHELAYRSWFLFGEQPAYPRAQAEVNGLLTYEQATGLNPYDTAEASNFAGNSVMGYKVALCERDVAIYASLLIFGLVYAATGRRLKSLPWYIWIAVGIIPIAVDGASQLPALLQTQWQWLAWFPARESTPWLRTITGFLFGFSTGWFGYPYAEESMRETRLIMARKMAVIHAEKSRVG